MARLSCLVSDLFFCILQVLVGKVVRHQCAAMDFTEDKDERLFEEAVSMVEELRQLFVALDVRSV